MQLEVEYGPMVSSRLSLTPPISRIANLLEKRQTCHTLFEDKKTKNLIYLLMETQIRATASLLYMNILLPLSILPF